MRRVAARAAAYVGRVTTPSTDPPRATARDAARDATRDAARDAAFARALDARDVRFDGVFFVGVTTTRIYCRPVCPARVSDRSRRRFFVSAASAERAGYRPCL